MNPMLKEFLWNSWVFLVSFAAVFDWWQGQLSGYWAFAVCWLSFVYIIDSLRMKALEIRMGA